MSTDLPIYHSNASLADKQAKQELLVWQLKAIASAPREQQMWMTCGCGQRAVSWQMYRCLYCGVFYCKACAEQHFGARKPAFDDDDEKPSHPNRKVKNE